MNGQLKTINQAAKYMGISTNTFKKYVHSQIWKEQLRLGRSFYYKQSTLDKFMNDLPNRNEADILSMISEKMNI